MQKGSMARTKTKNEKTMLGLLTDIHTNRFRTNRCPQDIGSMIANNLSLEPETNSQKRRAATVLSRLIQIEQNSKDC